MWGQTLRGQTLRLRSCADSLLAVAFVRSNARGNKMTMNSRFVSNSPAIATSDRRPLFVRRACAIASVVFVFGGCAAELGSSDDESLQIQDGVSSETSTSTDTEEDVPPALQGSGFSLIEEVVMPGRRVAFYELDDGSLLTVNVGKLGNSSTSPQETGLRGARLYEFLARKPASKRLVDADLRAGGTTEDAFSEPTNGSSDKAVPSCTAQGGCPLSPYTRANWLTDRCTGSRGYALRVEDLWVTGSSTVSGITTARFMSDLLVNQGRVRFEARWTDRGYAFMLVSANWYVQFSPASGGLGVIRKSAWSKVYEADGDIYDHCVRWD
jgi:hypothetical protein